MSRLSREFMQRSAGDYTWTMMKNRISYKELDHGITHRSRKEDVPEYVTHNFVDGKERGNLSLVKNRYMTQSIYHDTNYKTDIRKSLR